CGFIDTKGNMVVGAIYESARDFREGLAAVCINGKYGFIDKNGDLVIPAIYDGSFEDIDVPFFNNGLALVRLNGKWGYIDKNGTQYWED
ncbi:MAG: WG repeat-containing protein, partial [Caldiserica bacterium]|nr:WG repeat-containing protein [Caldisericota bacterium]